MIRAVFLDRDGVINQRPPKGDYVTAWKDFHILPGVAKAIALLNGAGFAVVVVTNQRCIAKSLISATEVEAIHRRMTNSLARAGATIDAIYYCPHEMEPACRCRKPAPGMLLDAADSRRIELTASWMIGDSEIDIEAGKNAGCKTARVSPAEKTGSADITATSLLDAVRQILHRKEVMTDSCPSDGAATKN